MILDHLTTTIPAGDVEPGHVFDLGAESITVTRVDHLPPEHVRIIGTLGDDRDPQDVVTVRIRREAALIVTRR